jgi:hypothetical protein
MLEINNLKGGTFYVGSHFRGFNPLSLGPIALTLVRENIIAERARQKKLLTSW